MLIRCGSVKGSPEILTDFGCREIITCFYFLKVIAAQTICFCEECAEGFVKKRKSKVLKSRLPKIED